MIKVKRRLGKLDRPQVRRTSEAKESELQQRCCCWSLQLQQRRYACLPFHPPQRHIFGLRPTFFFHKQLFTGLSRIVPPAAGLKGWKGYVLVGLWVPPTGPCAQNVCVGRLSRRHFYSPDPLSHTQQNRVSGKRKNVTPLMPTDESWPNPGPKSLLLPCLPPPLRPPHLFTTTSSTTPPTPQPTGQAS